MNKIVKMTIFARKEKGERIPMATMYRKEKIRNAQSIPGLHRRACSSALIYFVLAPGLCLDLHTHTFVQDVR